VLVGPGVLVGRGVLVGPSGVLVAAGRGVDDAGGRGVLLATGVLVARAVLVAGGGMLVATCVGAAVMATVGWTVLMSSHFQTQVPSDLRTQLQAATPGFAMVLRADACVGGVMNVSAAAMSDRDTTLCIRCFPTKA
jgi:hypothetical protein